MICHAQGCTNELPPPKTPGQARKWCSDRCRKSQYSVPCEDCGAPLNGSDGRGRNAPRRCVRCNNIAQGAESKVWTSTAVVLAIQEWAAEYGEPPAVPDWNPHTAEHVLHDPARARRFREAGGQWPNFKTVYREWGSWNAAIKAAGFTPRAPHGGGGNGARHRSVRERVS